MVRIYSAYTSVLNATTPAAPPPGGGPNEPAGLTTLVEEPWDLPPQDNPDWNIFPSEGSNNLVIRTTSEEGISSAPQSPNNVARIRINPNQDGTAPFNTWHTFSSGLKRLYFYYWIFHPVGYEPHTVQNKQFWPLPDNDNNSPLTGLRGSDLQVTYVQQGQNCPGVSWTSRTINANQGPSSHRNLGNWFGTWVRQEWYFEMNTVNEVSGDDTRADGIVRTWVTPEGQSDELVLQATDVKYLAIDGGQFENCRGENSNGTFRVLRWNPTFGGNTGQVVDTQFYYVDHIYISGSTTH